MARSTGTHTKATGTITSTKDYADADTVLIGNVTYRFKTTPAQANDVKRGTSEANTISNLVKAINGTGVGDGTDYYTGTSTVPAVIATDDGAHIVTLTARLGGSHGNAVHLAEGTDSGTAYSITRSMQGGAGALHTFFADLVSYEQCGSEVLADLHHVINAAAGA
jgi:hypothetical protein